jgi:glucokinase
LTFLCSYYKVKRHTLSKNLGVDMLILAGDIGGTNSRFSLLEIDEQKMPVGSSIEETYPSGNEGLAPLVQRFLGTDRKPDRACFAVAGPVLGNRCKITNLPWAELDGEKLQTDLDIPRVELINDFVAIGYSLVLEEHKELVTLQAGEFIKNAPIGIIGAGTGLGEAFAVPMGNSYQVFPTEGGHKNFAPSSELTKELLEYLSYSSPVDVEKVVSGPGITDIFRFLSDCKFPREDTGEFLSQVDTSQAISQGAKAGHFLCQKTMELFAEVYGSAVGDVALSLLPFGGLYLAGGIAAQNLEIMQSDTFIKAFRNKARIKKELIEKIPLHIFLNDLEGLKGARLYACQAN